MAEQEVWIKNQRSQEVTFPGPASAAVKIYLQRKTKIIQVPLPRQTPAPPQSFPEPQPGPPLGFQGPECEIQVTTLTPSVAAPGVSPFSLCSQGLLGLSGPPACLLLRSLAGHLGLCRGREELYWGWGRWEPQAE